MNETVGMMTSEESFLNNYGAALQGYALQRTIDKFGYESRIIRYNGYGPKRRFGFIKDLIKKILRIKRGTLTAKQKERALELKAIWDRHKSDIDKRNSFFDSYDKLGYVKMTRSVIGKMKRKRRIMRWRSFPRRVARKFVKLCKKN